MIRYLLLLLNFGIIDATHFNGGTIRWTPGNPYDNSTSIAITIIQSYSWSYPTISCANNVPISTSGRGSQNVNLTCVTDCSTDGGYSTKPVNILTDCTSSSSSLGMMTSQRSVNITLTAGAHFYLAHVGSAWGPISYPAQNGLEWSIVSFVDLRKRSDGFINTPPIASVTSPQYAIVNTTTQIRIPVSDVNAGDDIRCRWSTYTPGYRRRRRSHEDEQKDYEQTAQIYKKIINNEELIHTRKKRASGGSCSSTCAYNCLCSYSACAGTTCSGSKCATASGCPAGTTTVETPGTLKSTSSYPNRQAIDECGGICSPSSVPNGTTLSNCNLSFQGLVPYTWYAVAIQVEDFINASSLIPMSSVPVQFLIYIMPQPACSLPPIILSLTGCLEVTAGVSNNFTLFVMNLCDPNVAYVTDIIVSSGISGMQMGNLTNSVTNTSLVYETFTWTPQASQIGTQQLCTIAFTSEQVQSAQYCVTFTVITSSNLCATTTTSTTTTTTRTTSTTATTTSTSATTRTTSTTTTTTSTATTSTSATTRTTSTTTTTTSTATTSTSVTTRTTSTTTTTTSTATTSTSTTTTTTRTTSTTTTTTSTATTSTSATTTTTRTTSTTTSSTSTTSTSTTSTITTSTKTTSTSTTSTSTATTTSTSTTTTSTTTTSTTTSSTSTTSTTTTSTKTTSTTTSSTSTTSTTTTSTKTTSTTTTSTTTSSTTTSSTSTTSTTTTSTKTTSTTTTSTTTSSTSTTSTTTTSTKTTSTTTSSTSTTSTSTTSTSTATTTSTSTTTTTTTSATSTSTTTTSTTTTSTTSTSTTTTTTSATSTSTTTTTTSATSTSTTTTTTSATSTSTTASVMSTITSIANTVSASTNTAAPAASDTSGKDLSVGLIAGLSSLGLVLLLVFLCFCCLYCFKWSPAARRRRQVYLEEDQWQHRYMSSSTESMARTTPETNEILPIQIPQQHYLVYNAAFKPNSPKTSYMVIKNNPSTPTVPRGPFYRTPAAVQNWPLQHLPVTTTENGQN